jgi:GAF domain-containing protein
MPISELASAAAAISQGNLYRQASVKTRDEFSLLADVFNRMVVEMRDLVQSLEQRVSERTHSLERRTSQLEAAAQVARSAAAIRDLNRLLTETVQLISERFGFYHAGIFIIDDLGEFAVLKAANSPGGQRMLARGHNLRVGQVGIVGYAAGAGRSRIALDVGADAVYFNNPDLPQTRSEMALPLKVSGKVIGVLDVQSLEPNAFAQEDVEVLQILADQIALAIESARRLEESQQALAELNAVYGERTRQSWQERLHNQALTYRYGRPASGPANAGQAAAIKETVVSSSQNYEMEIPISLRGQALGAIRLRRAAEQSPWTAEEQELVRDALTQIAPALENARLLEEIQQRAHQESLVSQFATRVQTSLDLETVLRTAVNEIGAILDASRVRIRLNTDNSKPEDERNDS